MVVTIWGAPPLADTRRIADKVPEKRITPPGPHVPPRGSDASQIVCTGPPATSTRFSFPCAKNAIDRLSGDQNGNDASSVPASALGATASSGRTHSIESLPATSATNARYCPSGDSSSSIVG